jgi:predicted ATPase
VSIKAIQLRNFRGFHKAGIELKPLTVLLGPNSAGKSAFGHALAAMRHCQSKHGQSLNATLTPKDDIDSADWPVDLGQLSDLRTNGVTDPVFVDLLTADGWVEFGFGLVDPPPGLKHDLLFSHFSYPEAEISRPGPLTRQAQSSEPSAAQINLPVTDGAPGQFEVGSPPTFRRIDELRWHDGKGRAVDVQLDGLIVQTVKPKGSTNDLTLRSVARADIRSLFDNLAYLQATRQRPARGYKNEILRPQAIGYAGESTAGVLKKSGDNEIVFAAPSRIPETVDNAKATLDKPWEEKRLTLQTAVGEWLQKLGLADSISTEQPVKSEYELEINVTLPNQKPHNLCEVGFGISQIVPVLTAGLLQKPGSLFIVDLPEAHLHPRPQAELADFFCSLALSGRYSLVETHSTMFFYRLRLLAELNSDLAEKIAVYFIDPPNGGACVPPRKVGLSFDEELRWPPRFLEEAWETEARIAITREARRSQEK